MSLTTKEREELIDVILARLNKSVKIVMESQHFQSVAEKARDYILGSGEFNALVKRHTRTIVAEDIGKKVEEIITEKMNLRLSSLGIDCIENIVREQTKKEFENMIWGIKALHIKEIGDIVMDKIYEAIRVAKRCDEEGHLDYCCDD